MPEPQNDLTISNDEVLLRRLPHRRMMTFDEGLCVMRASSGAFEPDDDGLSVYRLNILQDNGLSAEDVKRAPENGVVAISAQEVRRCGLSVVYDPWPNTDNDSHPRDVAHTLLVGFSTLSKKQSKAKSRTLAKTAETLIDCN